MKYSGKKEMNTILKKYGKRMEKISNYDDYRRFYALWNFMKHNSMTSHKELKSAFPEILTEKHFENGHYSLGYLKLDGDTIPTLLNKLDNFFRSFCEEVFGEDPDETVWNYDDYFIGEFQNWKECIENPLGLPWWI